MYVLNRRNLNFYITLKSISVDPKLFENEISPLDLKIGIQYNQIFSTTFCKDESMFYNAQRLSFAKKWEGTFRRSATINQ